MKQTLETFMQNPTMKDETMTTTKTVSPAVKSAVPSTPIVVPTITPETAEHYAVLFTGGSEIAVNAIRSTLNSADLELLTAATEIVTERLKREAEIAAAKLIVGILSKGKKLTPKDDRDDRFPPALKSWLSGIAALVPTTEIVLDSRVRVSTVANKASARIHDSGHFAVGNDTTIRVQMIVSTDGSAPDVSSAADDVLDDEVSE